jgi:hypothetical protein
MRKAARSSSRAVSSLSLAADTSVRSLQSTYARSAESASSMAVPPSCGGERGFVQMAGDDGGGAGAVGRAGATSGPQCGFGVGTGEYRVGIAG